jgi:hypothetical protein
MSDNLIKLIPIQGRKEPAAVISQTDLEELIYLRRLLDEAHERWVAKREEVRTAIQAGAKTEPGVHQVAIVQFDDVPPRLVVR